MNLSDNIYRLRTGKNMSQGDLADALDVSRQSVSKWENGSAVPELEKLIKMSDLFGITLDELTGREAATVPPKGTESQNPPQIPARKIVGILLIISALVSLFVPGGLLAVFLFGTPLAVTGAVLAFAEADWLFRICWLLLAVEFPVICIFVLNFTRLDVAVITIVIALSALIAMAVWTILGIRRQKLAAPSKKIAMVSIVLILLLSVFFAAVLRMSTPELKSISTEAQVEQFEEVLE